MANHYRGEIDAVLDGKSWTLCLTLGALAELESAFNVNNLGALADRFSGGELSAKDLIVIIGCGLRGGGHTVSDCELADMRVDGGIVGYTHIVAALLKATFGVGEDLSDSGDITANPS